MVRYFWTVFKIVELKVSLLVNEKYFECDDLSEIKLHETNNFLQVYVFPYQ